MVSRASNPTRVNHNHYVDAILLLHIFPLFSGQNAGQELGNISYLLIAGCVDHSFVAMKVNIVAFGLQQISRL